MIDLGCLLAENKCIWDPKKEIVWLGHTMNFIQNKLYITEERITRLETTIESIMFQIKTDKLNVVSVRFLASIVGQIISLQNVFGKLVSRMTRYLYKCIISRASWNAPVQVNNEAIQELKFWKENA